MRSVKEEVKFAALCCENNILRSKATSHKKVVFTSHHHTSDKPVFWRFKVKSFIISVTGMESSGSSNEVFGNSHSNPMMNDLILKYLFDLMMPSHKQLGELRLVCKRWNSIALPPWLKRGRPIQLEEENDTFYKFITRHSGIDEDEDLLGLKRYPKFELIITQSHHPFPYQLFEIFWGEFGSWLTLLKLDFRRIQFPEVVTFKNILMCKYTHNLESLDIKMDRVNVFDRRLVPYWVPSSEETSKLQRFQFELGKNHQFLLDYIDWEEFFSYHSNLTHFGLKNRSDMSVKQKELMLDAIMDNLYLTSFQWFTYGWLPTSFCDKLREADWNLESLSICLAQEEEESIRNILSTHAANLKALEFQRSYPLEQSPFTQMRILRTLALYDIPMTNLQFLKDLPNLRSLSLWDGGSLSEENRSVISSTQLEEGPQTFPSLSKFCCNYSGERTADDIIRVAGWMPNLSHLGLMLNDVNFRHVCTSLPQLEHLVVYLDYGSQDSPGDKGIVGLVKDGADNINYTMPNITAFQQLKSLELQKDHSRSSGGRLSDELTEHSVIHGFLQLPRLERLVINTHEMNAQLKELLVDRIPFAKVTSTRWLT